jgi:hypothetical protein
MKALSIFIFSICGQVALGNSYLHLGKIATRNDYGHESALNLPFAAAYKFCVVSGQHLPTAREFAQIATLMGAKGILEVKDVELLGSVPEGYKLISAYDRTIIEGEEDKVYPTKHDQFYYSKSGFNKNSPPLNINEWLLFDTYMTTSYSKFYSLEGDNIYFSQENGEIYVQLVSDAALAQCLINY